MPRLETLLGLALFLGIVPMARAQKSMLVPMDLSQTNHLKAYGLAYSLLTQGTQVEWLLNYRGGSFLAPQNEAALLDARARDVLFETLTPDQVAQIKAEIEPANMEVVTLEKPPRLCVYTPPNKQPWDDPVTLALTYAGIPFDKVYDREVLAGKLAEYDWLYLHHGDFTGQYGKFYAAYRFASWYREDVGVNEELAQELGFTKVSEEKQAVARAIREYVMNGGFLFAMCSATDTIDIALAAEGLDIVAEEYDNDGLTPDAQSKLQYDKTLAFTNFVLEKHPLAYEFSNIDTSNYAMRRGDEADSFTLFEFDAKQEPVPTMLTQCHVNVINGFLGQTTGFQNRLVKDSVVLLGQVEGAEEVKYLYGNVGRGTFTFYGGHDPEDYQHMVGDAPTRLEQHVHSPGYRLIFNNVLFPAARKK